jgi:hypothetical protein
MIEQIENSINHDCSTDYYPDEIEKLKKQTAKQWHAENIQSAKWSIGYHKKELAREVELVTEDNEWIDKLYNSLN